MNTVEEFKEVIEGSYKIVDLKSYDEYKRSKTGAISVEELTRLSPDNINSSSFWEYIEKNPEIKNDAIAFGQPPTASIDDINRQNYSIACISSIFNYILSMRYYVNMPLLDIGAGYGMLRDFIKYNTHMKYHGVDVYPKFEGCLKVADDGYTLPEEIMKIKFGMVVSTNVFQHLSVNQRRKYYEQIEKILLPNGVFTVSVVALTKDVPSNGFKSQDGTSYICHYGQYTEIQTVEAIQDDLMKHFTIISYSRRCDPTHVFTFHCCKK